MSESQSVCVALEFFQPDHFTANSFDLRKTIVLSLFWSSVRSIKLHLNCTLSCFLLLITYLA